MVYNILPEDLLAGKPLGVEGWLSGLFKATGCRHPVGSYLAVASMLPLSNSTLNETSPVANGNR